MAHRAGFVNIIGLPNVGKSTLVNELVGEKIAIATPKAQTTRHRILGMLSEENYQIVFSDTPGIIHDPKYPMQEAMMNFVEEAWTDADLILFMLEFGQKLRAEDPILQKLKHASTPVYVVVNKVDKAKQEALLTYMQQLTEFFSEEQIFPISALNKYNVNYLLEHIVAKLPEHPPYYDKELFTDRSERFLVSELIREKIFHHFKQEIPYSVEVVVTRFKDSEAFLNIDAEIYVNRKSQKAIIIGKGGQALTRVGSDARRNLMNHYGKKVRLNLYVKIKEGWRDNESQLKKFGYKG